MTLKRSPMSLPKLTKAKGLTGILRVASFNAEPKRRTRKCAVCRKVFEPRNMTHKVCSPACGQALAEKVRTMADRKDTRLRLAALKTRSDHMKAAQVAFNAFIRWRDKDKLCISSGRPLQGGAIGGGFDAGHYRSIGSAPHLRFDPRNCHGQSKQDNRYLAGNAVDYRLGLIARIGQSAVDALEADQTPRKWTIDELIAIRATYKALLKELQK